MRCSCRPVFTRRYAGVGGIWWMRSIQRASARLALALLSGDGAPRCLSTARPDGSAERRAPSFTSERPLPTGSPPRGDAMRRRVRQELPCRLGVALLRERHRGERGLQLLAHPLHGSASLPASRPPPLATSDGGGSVAINC